MRSPALAVLTKNLPKKFKPLLLQTQNSLCNLWTARIYIQRENSHTLDLLICSTCKLYWYTFVHLYTAETYVKRANCIDICAFVHCRDLCWACKANCKDFGRSWSVQAAPLQSQTGFDHHHSNSATALTFIKYLLMFRQVIIHDLDERAAGLFTIQINVHPPTSVLRNQFHEHVQAVKEHVR